jgi:AcrR family transcriptional regulator
MSPAQRLPMTERILAAADRLFYSKGIRAVGVDAIAAEAGVSKRSLYDTFASKEALIEAYLRRHVQVAPAGETTPAAAVLALFDGLHARFARADFRGCPFVNAVAELAEECGAARAIAARYKTERRGHIRDLLAQAGARDAEALARQVALLSEGAIASMLVHGDPAVALQAREAALVLMRAGGVKVEPAGADGDRGG